MTFLRDKSALQSTPNISEKITLRDGRQVLLRSVQPKDRDLIRESLTTLSIESNRHRFLSYRTNFSDSELKYLTELDGKNHYAIGATTLPEDGPICGVAIARWIRNTSDPKIAEWAIIVTDSFQQQGLGGLMLNILAETARSQGIEKMVGTLATDHFKSQALIEKIGKTKFTPIGGGTFESETWIG